MLVILICGEKSAIVDYENITVLLRAPIILIVVAAFLFTEVYGIFAVGVRNLTD